MEIDIMWRQKMESYFQSALDRLRNVDTPDQIRPKEKFRRKPLKGVARQLYLDRKSKLSKAESDASRGLVKPKKKEIKDETG